jgi:hypothetical protein
MARQIRETARASRRASPWRQTAELSATSRTPSALGRPSLSSCHGHYGGRHRALDGSGCRAGTAARRRDQAGRRQGDLGRACIAPEQRSRKLRSRVPHVGGLNAACAAPRAPKPAPQAPQSKIAVALAQRRKIELPAVAASFAVCIQFAALAELADRSDRAWLRCAAFREPAKHKSALFKHGTDSPSVKAIRQERRRLGKSPESRRTSFAPCDPTAC